MIPKGLAGDLNPVKQHDVAGENTTRHLPAAEIFKKMPESPNLGKARWILSDLKSRPAGYVHGRPCHIKIK